MSYLKTAILSLVFYLIITASSLSLFFTRLLDPPKHLSFTLKIIYITKAKRKIIKEARVNMEAMLVLLMLFDPNSTAT